MKVLLTVAFHIALSHFCWAQPVDSLWSRMLGGTGTDQCTAVLQASDGGFVFSGRTDYSPTDVDAWVVKTNPLGDIEWSRTIGGGAAELAFDVVAHSGGGYAMVGYTASYGAGLADVYFATLSSQGEIQDISFWGGTEYESGNALAATADGGFVIGGETSSFGAGSSDFWLIKTDGDGAASWTQTYGGSQQDICYAVRQVTDGGYALAGYTTSFGSGGADAWLVRTSSSGQILWSRTFGWATDDVTYDMIQTSDGGFALAGHTQNGGSGERDFYLVKTDAYGTQQWTHSYGGVNDEFCRSIQQTSDGGYILTGSTYSFGTGSQDIWLIRLSSSGALLWSRTFGGTGTDDCNSVAVTSDGGFVLGGQTTSFSATQWDIWLIRTGVDPSLEAEDYRPLLADFALHPIFPNPFNNAASITLDLPRDVSGSVVVYDALGRMANTLYEGPLSAGRHALRFNANNMSSGCYFVRFESANYNAAQRAVLLK
ncbi:T9SS type A sorting domain-containing protein [candidate division KSB1 bacterium]|nr:T9SS type A sorting domain-containing protein [candidate division KSB1 bacterium]